MSSILMNPTSEEVAPLLSITVLNYNYAQYLPTCLTSILTQDWTDFELILINDCSTDNSLEVVQPFLTDARVRLINHPQNQGFVSSLLEGVLHSRGKYITVISADDYCLSPLALGTLIAMMEADDAVAYAYAAHRHCDTNGKLGYLRRPHEHSYIRPGPQEFRDLVLECYVMHSGTIIRRGTYDAVGGYDASARYAVDYKLWLVLCSRGKVAYSAEQLFAYRVHQSSMAHSIPSARRSLDEMIDGIRDGFTALHGSLERPDELRALAYKRVLVSMPTYDIFSGRLRRGWYGYWASLQVSPRITLLQSRTIILILRTILGDAVYQRGLSIYKRLVSIFPRSHIQHSASL